MKIIKILCSVLAMAFGVFMVIYGESDDSPGGQGLGLLFFIIGAVSMVRMWKGIFRK